MARDSTVYVWSCEYYQVCLNIIRSALSVEDMIYLVSFKSVFYTSSCKINDHWSLTFNVNWNNHWFIWAQTFAGNIRLFRYVLKYGCNLLVKVIRALVLLKGSYWFSQSFSVTFFLSQEMAENVKNRLPQCHPLKYCSRFFFVLRYLIYVNLHGEITNGTNVNVLFWSLLHCIIFFHVMEWAKYLQSV